MNFQHTYQCLSTQLWQTAPPDRAPAPRMIVYNEGLAKNLGIDEQLIIDCLSGAAHVHCAQPIAQAYAGHQFGRLNRLGDGRATLLGELSVGGQLLDIQLKGSGRTPYAHHGDGKANLAPMMREYLMSEAMYALGVPTTRALAVVDTGEYVRRKHHRKGAVLARVASSHIRVGTFVHATIAAYDKQDMSIASDLLHYALQRHYPESSDIDNAALALLSAVIEKQAMLMAQWRRVGFIHGVMNTDNVTISGETIDYGPCAFMDAFDEAAVFSSIDNDGRYAFGNQAPIMQWNMGRLAESLLPLIDAREEVAIELANDCLDAFETRYHHHWHEMACAKAGVADDEWDFVAQLFPLMHERGLDYTNTFVDLTAYAMGDTQRLDALMADAALSEWLTGWKTRFDSARISEMQRHNPVVIPRNHLVENALKGVEQGDVSAFNALYSILQRPYDWRQFDQLKPYQQPASRDWNQMYKTFCGT